MARAAKLDLLVLVEDVLLELFPVVVAAGEHLPHEDVKVGLCAQARRRPGRREHEQDGEGKVLQGVQSGGSTPGAGPACFRRVPC
jgi:hypothetical protein